MGVVKDGRVIGKGQRAELTKKNKNRGQMSKEDSKKTN